MATLSHAQQNFQSLLTLPPTNTEDALEEQQHQYPSLHSDDELNNIDDEPMYDSESGAMPPPPLPPPPPIGAPPKVVVVWREIYSAQHGRNYYCNCATGETSWVEPDTTDGSVELVTDSLANIIKNGVGEMISPSASTATNTTCYEPQQQQQQQQQRYDQRPGYDAEEDDVSGSDMYSDEEQDEYDAQERGDYEQQQYQQQYEYQLQLQQHQLQMQAVSMAAAAAVAAANALAAADESAEPRVEVPYDEEEGASSYTGSQYSDDDDVDEQSESDECDSPTQQHTDAVSPTVATASAAHAAVPQAAIAAIKRRAQQGGSSRGAKGAAAAGSRRPPQQLHIESSSSGASSADVANGTGSSSSVQRQPQLSPGSSSMPRSAVTPRNAAAAAAAAAKAALNTSAFAVTAGSSTPSPRSPGGRRIVYVEDWLRIKGEEYTERKEAARTEAASAELIGVTLRPHLICPWRGGARPSLEQRLEHDAERRAKHAARAAAEAVRRETAELTCKPRVTKRGHSAPARGVDALHTFQLRARAKTAARAAAAAAAAASRHDPKPCAMSEKIVAKLRASGTSPMTPPPGGQTPQERLYREAQQQQRRAQDLQVRATAAARAAASSPHLAARGSRADRAHASERRGDAADRLYYQAQQAVVRKRAAETERERLASLPPPPPPAPAVDPQRSAELAARGRRARGGASQGPIEEGLLAAGKEARDRRTAAAARQLQHADAAATAPHALQRSLALAERLESASGESAAQRLLRPAGRVRESTLAALPDTVESTFAPALAAARTSTKLLHGRYGEGSIPARYERQSAWVRESEQRKDIEYDRQQERACEELTFAPALRACRASTAVEQQRARSGADVAERGAQFEKSHAKKVAVARARAADEEVAECTFHPAVTGYELPWSGTTAAATAGTARNATAGATAAAVAGSEPPRSPYAKKDKALAKSEGLLSSTSSCSSARGAGVSLHYEHSGAASPSSSAAGRKHVQETLPSGWLAFTTTEGHRYFYSAIDGTTTWDAPAR